VFRRDKVKQPFHRGIEGFASQNECNTENDDDFIDRCEFQEKRENNCKHAEYYLNAKVPLENCELNTLKGIYKAV
jgi:hypothetical protein